MAIHWKRLLARPSVRFGALAAIAGGAISLVANLGAVIDLITPDDTRALVEDTAETVVDTGAKVNELLALMRNEAALQGAGLDPQSEETIRLALTAILSSGDARKATARRALREGRVEDAAAVIGMVAEEQAQAAGETSRAAAESWRETGALLDSVRPQEAVAAYARAHALDPDNLYNLLDQAAIQIRLGQFSEAEQALAPVFAAAGSESPERAHGLRYRARIARARGHYDQAQEDFRAALALLADADMPLAQLTAKVNLAAIRRRLGDLDAAQNLLQEALETARATEQRSAEALALSNLGVNQAAKGDLHTAHQSFAEADAIYAELGDPMGQVLTTGNLGALAIQLGDWGVAEQHLLRSAELGERLGLKESLAYDHNNLADLALRRDDQEAADRHAAQALSLADEIGLDGLRPYIRITMGEIALARGDLGTACTHLGAARGEMTASGDVTAGVVQDMMDTHSCNEFFP